MPSKKSNLLQFPAPAEPGSGPEPPSSPQAQISAVNAVPEYQDTRNPVLAIRLDFAERKAAIYSMFLASTDARRHRQARQAVGELRRELREELRERRIA